MAFPRKDYDRLHNLAQRWGVSQDDVDYAVENGMLRACIWLPLRHVERVVLRDGAFQFVRHELKEGFIAIRPEDYRCMLGSGRKKLRIFHSVKNEGNILRLAYEPPQPDIMVRLSDLVVLDADILKFEKTYNVASSDKCDRPKWATCNKSGMNFSNDYRHITFGDDEYHLGDVQARVIRRLFDAAQSHKPWVHGKKLIDESGSRADRLRDLFKHKSEWRNLIASNKRGYYRLNIPLPENADHPAKISAER